MASGIWHLACQTYALNLFHFRCSLNQTQFLFVSPKLSKSLHLTKSPCLSAVLSPRPRHLSFLSKLSDLLKLFRLPKLPLFFALLLLLSYAQCSIALTANTSKEIEGSAPYLTFDGGRTKVTDADNLLSIRLQDGRVITPSTNPSSAANPISLPYVGSNLGHITMVVPSSQSSISMNDLVVQGNWEDDDGDGQGANGVTATGSISVSFTDKNGNTVNRSDALDICNAPYRVRLVSTEGSLTTQYGVPRSSNFGGAMVDYYINPYNTVARVCYARPNLYFGGTGATVNNIRDDSHYAGPSNIWSPTKGFLTQSNDYSSYDQNFPTTGADGLYFDLELPAGVDGSQLTWPVVTNGSIRATVSWTKPRSGAFTDPHGNILQADEWIRDKSSYVTRVTLSGPRADRTQINTNNPSPLAVPSLPQKFELVGRDSRGNEVRYGFVLKQWFVHRGKKWDSQYNQISWCSSLGYRLPQVKDLTNAVRTNSPSISGARPSSPASYYQRHIGAGFFTEWGVMYRYADVGFVHYGYWTSDTTGSNGFDVYSQSGDIYSDSVSDSRYAVCSSP
ncbi:hypothetical protein GA0061081_102374 [Gilliamella bombicola]|uniref:Uncharacterized protein n=1 Tax=Gilliamella bombicola TaxID=1798182 RepID=A0A1C4AEW1_9GAMM|nr:hypothetical protein [Gilliamella bombicola]SCB93001.1 hypothetical protein GA0061081_102374 [Gilliamella bombicola]